MKKILAYTSIALVIIIIFEIVYIFYSKDAKTGVNKLSTQAKSDIVVVSESKTAVIPTRPNIPIPTDYNPPDYIMVEGKIYEIQGVNVDNFTYSIRLIKPDGEAHEVLFEKGNEKIMTVMKVDSNTKEQTEIKFDDIKVNDNIKVEFFIDLEKQRQNTRSITAERILITIF